MERELKRLQQEIIRKDGIIAECRRDMDGTLLEVAKLKGMILDRDEEIVMLKAKLYDAMERIEGLGRREALNV